MKLNPASDIFFTRGADGSTGIRVLANPPSYFPPDKLRRAGCHMTAGARARIFLPRAFKHHGKSCPNGIALLRAGIQRKSAVIQVNDKCPEAGYCLLSWPAVRWKAF